VSEPQAIRTGFPGRDQGPVQFGPFKFSLETGRLTQLGIVRRLEKQPATVLAYLIEHRGRMVTRAEVIQLLWPDQEHGDFDHRLDKVVAKLRFALGDSAVKTRFVETFRGRGFRFTEQVIYAITPARRATDNVETEIADPELSLETLDLDASDPQVATGFLPLSARARHSKARLGYFIAAGMIAALVVGFALRGRLRNRLPHDGAATMPTVVVLGMRPSEDSGEDTWISRATASWLAEDMYAHGQLRVLSGTGLADLNAAIPLGSDKGLSRQILDQIRSRTGADFIVFGSYTVQSHDTAKPRYGSGLATRSRNTRLAAAGVYPANQRPGSANRRFRPDQEGRGYSIDQLRPRRQAR
jgi:DNA-binding winged helix-turn-helix (wHTH) protein